MHKYTVNETLVNKTDGDVNFKHVNKRHQNSTHEVTTYQFAIMSLIVGTPVRIHTLSDTRVQ